MVSPLDKFDRQAKRDRLVVSAIRRLTNSWKRLIPGNPRFAADEIAFEVIADPDFDLVAQPETIMVWVRAAAQRGRIKAHKHGRTISYSM